MYELNPAYKGKCFNTFDNSKSPDFESKKNKSAFDEYEQRGGVLEGYEDLNSSVSNEG